MKNIPLDERPMEKLIAYGPGVLTDSELIANIIRSGTQSQSSLDIARSMLLEHSDGLPGLSELSLEELMQQKGIGRARACQLSASFEIGRRSQAKKLLPMMKITNTKEVVGFFQAKLGHLKKENLAVVYLNTKNEVIYWEIVSVGILNMTLVHPREVFRTAVQKSAQSVIVLHNHPSGDTEPSQVDIDITERLRKSGEMIGIKLLDHVIISSGSHCSLKERGYI